MDIDWNDPKIADQIRIDQAMARAMIDFIPESWEAAEWRLTWLPKPRTISHLVVNPDTGAGWTVSQEMVDLAILLDEHRRKYDLQWRSAIYSVRLDEEGNWQANANFTFE